jgi:hypothetical protein
MAITRLGGANAISGTIPQGNIANASLGAVTALPAAISTGKVLQVVNAKLETENNTTSTSFVATSLTATITPSSSSNKVLITLGGPIYQNTGDKYYYGAIYRGGSNVSNGPLCVARNNGSSIGTNLSAAFLDSPATTSATTYTYYHKTDSGGTGYVSINDWGTAITLMEIEA